jgi:hypothetical protein
MRRVSRAGDYRVPAFAAVVRHFGPHFCLAVPYCWLMAGDLEGLLTQARTSRRGLRASSPAADQLVLGYAEPGEKAVVLDRVG